MTTGRFKDFGAGKDNGKKEPLVFKLHGEEFQCIPQVQGQVMLNLVIDSNSTDPSATARVISGFFKSECPSMTIDQNNMMTKAVGNSMPSQSEMLKNNSTDRLDSLASTIKSETNSFSPKPVTEIELSF
jgi:hypothetical protein